jgi:hypothetical protein
MRLTFRPHVGEQPLGMLLIGQAFGGEARIVARRQQQYVRRQDGGGGGGDGVVSGISTSASAK